MLRRILVALDGSPLAESALSLAGDLARMSGASVVLVQAVPTGEMLESFDPANPNVFRYVASAPTSPTDSLIAREVRSEAREYLQPLACDLTDRGVKVEIAVVPGDPADILIDEARLRHASLIVMSTHGRSGLKRWLFGSVAEAVVSRSATPVLLDRSGMPTTTLTSADRGIRLLIPLDGSATAEKALGAAGDLARGLKAEVFLVRIVPSSPGSMTGRKVDFNATRDPHPVDRYEREAETYLDAVAARLRADGLTVSTAAASDHPPHGIVAAAEASGASMIVMATHGRTGLGRAILGSVALEVLHRGTRPVLLVRPTSDGCAQPTEACSDSGNVQDRA